MPTIPSYLFENLILNYFDSQDKVSQWIDLDLIDFWSNLITAIKKTVIDPKGFQDDLNYLSYYDRIKISNKAKDTYDKAMEANKFETQDKNPEKAINKWRKIFGNDFPKYD